MALNIIYHGDGSLQKVHEKWKCILPPPQYVQEKWKCILPPPKAKVKSTPKSMCKKSKCKSRRTRNMLKKARKRLTGHGSLVDPAALPVVSPPPEVGGQERLQLTGHGSLVDPSGLPVASSLPAEAAFGGEEAAAGLAEFTLMKAPPEAAAAGVAETTAFCASYEFKER